MPVTMEVNIVVDNTLASCYADFNHDLAHFIMTPIRWFPKIMWWIFGTDNRFQNYVTINRYMGRWLLPFQQQNNKLVK